MRVLGIIPARGGSKGVPRKNIRELAGRPLLWHSIQAARASGLDRLVVSTEDEEIVHIAQQCEVTVCKRAPQLAEDHVPMVPVLQHALAQLMQTDNDITHVMLLQPTCPLRRAEDIDAVLALLRGEPSRGVISVYEVGDMHPGRMYRMEDEQLESLWPEWQTAQRQELPPVYHRNGAIYAVSAETLCDAHTLMPEDARPYIMPAERSVNIDTEMDWQLAEFFMERTGAHSES